MSLSFARLLGDETGVTAIEYAMLGSFIALVIAAALDAVGTNLSTVFTTVATNM